ncbi:hypothetical protein PMAYCL1PPCAC_07610, partial [Pristionchus mayeri]
MRLLRMLLSIFAVWQVDSYKILVYNSKYGHSHSNFLGMIADTLAETGHNVTSLIPILDKSLKDGSEKSRKIYIQPDPAVGKRSHFTGPSQGEMFYLTCKRVMGEPGLIERLRNEKYDVYISENFDVCGMGLSHAIQPKAVIGTSATSLFGWQFDEFGVPEAVSYRPSPAMSSLDVHSFFDRLLNIYTSCLNRIRFSFSRRSVDRALREYFGEEYPSVAEQSSNVAFVFTNSEPLLDYAAPTLARVVEIPGIGAKTPKPLDEYWSAILSRRDRNVLLSFGSQAKSFFLPLEMKKAIVEAISRFPDVTFIWKYEKPEDKFCQEFASEVPNLVLSKWMPQVDILNHPNLSLFITHGGMGSTQETAMRGVPGIFIPIFGDQPRNAGMMEYNGFGKVFDKNDLGNADKLATIIREMLENDKYRTNARRISSMVAKKPFNSRERLIKT